MDQIKNNAELVAAIRRLQQVVQQKEDELRIDVHDLYHQLLPSVMFASAVKRVRADIKENFWDSLTWKTLQSGLLLWTGHLLYKTKNKVEKNIIGVVNASFNRLKGIVGGKN